MSLYVPSAGGGFAHAGAATLDRQLREGDGIHWSGDQRLSLAIASLEETNNGIKTGRIAHRYEVYRWCEDGVDRRIGTWRMEEFGQILFDIARLRAGAEGRAEGVLDRIDKHNDAKEQRAFAKYREKGANVIERGAWLLNRLRGEPKTNFGQVGGSRDDPVD